jgi:hypothetical protein
MPTIKEVVEGRIAYAKQQSAARRSRATELGERASRNAQLGQFRAAADDALMAERQATTAEMWEACQEALLQPILMALDAK